MEKNNKSISHLNPNPKNNPEPNDNERDLNIKETIAKNKEIIEKNREMLGKNQFAYPFKLVMF